MRAGTAVVSLAIALLMWSPFVVHATVIEIVPAYDFRETNETFYVEVVCTPTEPVKAFEMEMHFDQSKIEAIAVTRGTFFGSYPVFFGAPLIDNVNGTIRNVYAVIIGAGNVSDVGTMAIIEFSALEEEGISSIHFTSIGITNETQYLEQEAYGATVQVYDTYPPWDTNKDGVVNAVDISCVASQYGDTCVAGAPGDINRDGIIDCKDISLIVGHYG